MPVETAADRAAFVSADEFGELLSWTAGAVTTTVPGIPSTGALRIEQMDGAGMLGRNCAVLVSVDALPLGAGNGDAVTFRSASHSVKSIEPDGTGMALVRLEEVVADPAEEPEEGGD